MLKYLITQRRDLLAEMEGFFSTNQDYLASIMQKDFLVKTRFVQFLSCYSDDLFVHDKHIDQYHVNIKYVLEVIEKNERKLYIIRTLLVHHGLR